MPKKSNCEVKVSEIKLKQKNGDIYVYERKYKYDRNTKNNKCLGDVLKYKISPDGTIKNTRPKRKINSDLQLEVAASKSRIGAMEILNFIGEKSGIDQALYDIADIGDAKKIISIARYLVCTDGHTLPNIQEWQLTHKLPYEEGITKDVYGKLFEQLGLNHNLIQNYFKKRIDWCDVELLIAYDSSTQSTYSKNQDNARLGFNKEGINLPTIKFIVLYSIKDMQPIAYTREPGNLPDITSISNAIKQLKSLGVKIAEVVTDNGYYSEQNIGELLYERMDFITLAKPSLGWIKKEIDEHYNEFSKESNYCTNDFNMTGIIVPITKSFTHVCQKSDKRTGVKKGDKITFDKKIYLHLYLNEDKKVEENRKFRKEIMELMNDINNGMNIEDLDENSYKKATKYLEIKKKRGGKIEAKINDDEMEKANKYNGFIALVSNKEKQPSECILKYRLREKIEENFQIFKDDCDGNRIRNWYDNTYQGKLFVQFVAMGYYDYLYSEIKRIKKEINDYISSSQNNSQELTIYRSLKTWLHDMSLERLLGWFDVIEETVVSYELKRKYWTTETTKRDRLFLKLLGMPNIEC